MPRKQAKSTRFVKNVKNNTALANQRMQASSRKRMAKLMKKRSVYGLRSRFRPDVGPELPRRVPWREPGPLRSKCRIPWRFLACRTWHSVDRMKDLDREAESSGSCPSRPSHQESFLKLDDQTAGPGSRWTLTPDRLTA